jgi:predicted Rossmann fold flavoprotein
LSDRPSKQAIQTATDLVIVGSGASGLMAAVCAGEKRIRCMLIERRHRPGLKLLMCGNNRCNITHRASVEEMQEAYGPPVADFLAPALRRLSPADLLDWFRQRGLQTTVHDDDRVFPRSENADDVLHCFTDLLRDLSVPLVLNSAVTGIDAVPGGYRIRSDAFDIVSRTVLLATGGVSYPKTGSVGDGQRFARDLGHKIAPYRPGLAGIEFEQSWLRPAEDISLPETRVTIFAGQRAAGETCGEILLSRQCARGPAMVNATRLIARDDLRELSFSVDLFPDRTEGELHSTLSQAAKRCRGDMPRALSDARLLPPPLCRGFVAIARALKNWTVIPVRIRPLKEAMVTVGGVFLDEIDPHTLESRLRPGLFFAGEVMDVDGPTGGYNLHAAFATAQLAVDAVAAKLDARGRTRMPPADLRRPTRRRKRRTSRRR